MNLELLNPKNIDIAIKIQKLRQLFIELYEELEKED